MNVAECVALLIAGLLIAAFAVHAVSGERYHRPLSDAVTMTGGT